MYSTAELLPLFQSRLPHLPADAVQMIAEAAAEFATEVAAMEREACAKLAESLKTLKASLPTGPNGEHEQEHATIHGAAIAEAIRARSNPST